MVGLAAIAEFTHGIEAVLDRIRRARWRSTRTSSRTLLEARDHLAAMVEAEAARSPIPASAELNQRLTAPAPRARAAAAPAGRAGPPGSAGTAAGRHRRRPAAAPPPAAATPAPQPGSRAAASDAAEGPPAPKPAGRGPGRKPRPAEPGPKPQVARRWTGRRPAAGRAAGRAGRRPGSRLPDHAQARAPTSSGGGSTRWASSTSSASWARRPVETDPELVPPLDEIDPERCYLIWTIEVETDAGPSGSTTSSCSSPRTARSRSSGGGRRRRSSRCRRRRRGRRRRRAAGAGRGPDRRRAASPSPPAGPGRRGRRGRNGRARGRRRPPARRPAAGPGRAAAAGPPAPRPHARIRVDADQLDDLVGLAGELAVLSDNLQGLRELAGVAALGPHARGARAGQPADPRHDARPADGAGRRAVLAVPAGRPRPGRPLGQGDRAADRRPGDAARPDDRRAAERPDDPPDPQRRRPRAGDARGAAGQGQAAGRAGSRSAAGHEGDRVAIRVEDDGRGLDREKIVRKGIALGLVPPGTSPDDPRVDQPDLRAGLLDPRQGQRALGPGRRARRRPRRGPGAARAAWRSRARPARGRRSSSGCR